MDIFALKWNDRKNLGFQWNFLITLLEHSHGKPTHWNQDTGWYRRFAMSKLNMSHCQILIGSFTNRTIQQTPQLSSLASFVLRSCEAHASPGRPWMALWLRLQTQEWRWLLGLRSTFPSPGSRICLEQISLSGVVRSYAFCLNSHFYSTGSVDETLLWTRRSVEVNESQDH